MDSDKTVTANAAKSSWIDRLFFRSIMHDQIANG
jgi:hypothetical protein